MQRALKVIFVQGIAARSVQAIMFHLRCLGVVSGARHPEPHLAILSGLFLQKELRFGSGVWPRPLAAYLKIPRETRLWWRQSAAERPNDIFEIEAVGPLAILATWPDVMRDATWVHYIDNSAAQHSLIRGSSSVTSGDLIVGHTWETVARRSLLPWFERVPSASNPVDSLSRGDMAGPWGTVVEAKLPKALLADLRRLLAFT